MLHDGISAIGDTPRGVDPAPFGAPEGGLQSAILKEGVTKLKSRKAKNGAFLQILKTSWFSRQVETQLAGLQIFHRIWCVRMECIRRGSQQGDRISH